MTSIAIVILNWNGADMMRRFLPSVVACSEGEGRVIVADNGSTDGSLPMLEAEFPTVGIIRLHENHGFAEGYNRALSQVEADYYLLLNSDVEVTPGWLRPLRAYMDAHPETAACQPKLLSWKDKTKFEYAGAAGGYLDRYGYPFCRGRVMNRVETDLGQYDGEALPALWASGAALMVRSADWKSAGGLDGRFFAHMEEIDLCWRLRTRGRRVACVPSSRVYHVGGATLARENPRKTFLNFRNNLLMLYKNLPDKELDGVMRARRWLDHAAALKFLLTGDAANAKAVWQARREFRRLRPGFAADRAENRRKAVAEDIPERTAFSLLAAYYLRGRRTFPRLMSGPRP